jgi:ADP-dependent NAD(P)H-hydrate dehydratase / NAD(P)H-hydrate epimerase
MKIATSKQMKGIDRRAIREFGIPGPVLMENAAAAVMTEMEAFFHGPASARIGILCGKGNNGGDGLALARRLSVRGRTVRAALLAPFDEVSGDAGINLSVLRRMEDKELVRSASIKTLREIIAHSDILVDAMFGTGLSGPLTGLYARAVELVDASGLPVVSIDVPTGIDADTGRVMGKAVKADLTVTMTLLKRGLVLYPGAAYAGVVRVADLGIPLEAVAEERIDLSLIDGNSLRDMLDRRPLDSHKGDFGRLLVIAGSPGMTGAAVLAARAALRSGTGLVRVAAPSGQVPVIQVQLCEAVCVPSAESSEGTLGTESEGELLKGAAAANACAVGPGLSNHFETAQVVRNLLQRIAVPMVIDADALNALAGHTDLLKKVKAPVILTPHPGEMGRLLGVSTDDVQKDRIGLARDFARRHRVVLVLKGAGTVVATPDGTTFINSTGNPGMASGGTGDALTGVIGGFLAQGRSPVDAARLGVYLHGLAGDLTAREKGEVGSTAGDLIEQLPEAIRKTAEN